MHTALAHAHIILANIHCESACVGYLLLVAVHMRVTVIDWNLALRGVYTSTGLTYCGNAGSDTRRVEASERSLTRSAAGCKKAIQPPFF